MNLWLQRARRALPFVISGVALTLFMAWGVPVILAMRGLGPKMIAASSSTAPSVIDSDRAMRNESSLGVMSDWYLAYPSDEFARDYTSINTMRAGWPLRAFAGELWCAANRPAQSDDLRWIVEVGESTAHQTVIPLRPLLVGVTGDIVFWSTASWFVIALPLALRNRKLQKYGLCGSCRHVLDHHAVKRPDRCPACNKPLARDWLAFARSPEMHFQNAYVWFVFVSSLDIMLTWKILARGGLEVNPLAALIIDTWGMHGAIAFKFALMTWVIVVCEILARMRMSAGRFLAYTAVVLSALPVVWSLGLLVLHELFPA